MRIQKLLPLGTRSTEALQCGLQNWFSSPAGQSVMMAEVDVLRAVVPRFFGYYCVYAGPIELSGVLSECTIKRHFRVVTGMGDVAQTASTSESRVSHARHAHVESTSSTSSLCIGKMDALPFDSNSVDAMLLHHCLDTEMNPHSVLREACRVLMPGGSIVIAGFNPWSLWGLWRVITLQAGFARTPAPWGCRFVSPYRLSDWLNLLDFEVEGYETRVRWPTVYTARDTKERDPCTARLGNAARFQSLSDRYLRHFGTVYIMVAKKREACMTPLRTFRQQSTGSFRPVVAAHVREPTAVSTTVSSLVEARRKRDDDPA
ncbi:MAG: methyltransferase domain-containing protein [Gammaproteobacteria bacterium]